jgi:hypothetical protein
VGQVRLLRPRLPEELAVELERLLAEVAQLRAERDLYLASLYALTREEIPFDKKAILANLSREPSLDRVLAELEAINET